MTDQEFLDLCKRAAGLAVDAYGDIGSGGRGNTMFSRRAELALVELMAVEVSTSDDRRPGAYLEHPAHLPDDDKELRALHASTASRDRDLRADLVEWARMNREVLDRNVQALRVPVEAIHKAVDLMNTSTDEDEKDKIFRWARTVNDYVIRHFKVNPDSAPRDPAKLRAWCRERMSKGNPTPTWLMNTSAPPAPPAQSFEAFRPGAPRDRGPEWNDRRHPGDNDDD